MLFLELHPTCRKKDGRHPVERRDDCIGLVVRQWFAACRGQPRPCEIQARRAAARSRCAGVYMDEIVHADAKAVPEAMKIWLEWLVLTGLLSRDDTVDGTAKLGDISGDDSVVSVR